MLSSFHSPGRRRLNNRACTPPLKPPSLTSLPGICRLSPIHRFSTQTYSTHRHGNRLQDTRRHHTQPVSHSQSMRHTSTHHTHQHYNPNRTPPPLLRQPTRPSGEKTPGQQEGIHTRHLHPSQILSLPRASQRHDIQRHHHRRNRILLLRALQ